MPRLTRTQKFADLREQLANDKEEKIVSQDFSSFQNRFVSTENIVAPNKETVKEVEEPAETVLEEATVLEETPIIKEEPIQEINDTPVVEEQMEGVHEAIDEEPVQEVTTVEEWVPFVEEKVEEVVKEEPINIDTESDIEEDIIWVPFEDKETKYNPEENEFGYYEFEASNDNKPENVAFAEEAMIDFEEIEIDEHKQLPVEEELDADKEQPVEEKVEESVPETVITYDRPAFENPVFSGPAFENPAFENPTFDKFVPDVEEITLNNEPKLEEAVSIEEPKENIASEQPVADSYFDKFVNEPIKKIEPADDFNSYFEDFDNQDGPKSEVFKDVADESGEYVSIKERNVYLDQTLSDVKLYNENVGEQTINQLLESSVDEIRHPESTEKEEVDITEVIENNSLEKAIDNDDEIINPIADDIDKMAQNTVVEEQHVNEVVINEEEKNDLANDYANIGEEENFKLDFDSMTFDEKEDEKFSNTVTMEISKIMDEMSNHNVEDEIKPELEENSLDVMGIEEKRETIVDENPEDVVEIKNISEIKQEEVNTMSATKTFVVASDEDDADGEDEDGSNTVLNVILIVLIVVLIAVLGLIVFYILKTKGIF